MDKEMLKRLFQKTTNESVQDKLNRDSHPYTDTLSGNNSCLQKIKISELLPYPNQPFKPYIGDKLNQLAESIRQNGVLTPLIVQKTDEETYRIISGHNRVAAAKLIELDSVPCIVKKIADAEAEIILTETNLMSRTEILPSEKAFAYKMRLDAMKRQGFRSDLTSAPLEQKFSVEQIAENSNDSRAQIQRYIRLTNLIPELLELVDEGKIKMRPAVELSYLDETEQSVVHQYFFAEQNKNIDIAASEKLKEMHSYGEINTQNLAEAFSEHPEKVKRVVNVKIKFRKIKQYFEKSASQEQIEETILRALEQYFDPERRHENENT